jgi:hypothetical protein
MGLNEYEQLILFILASMFRSNSGQMFNGFLLSLVDQSFMESKQDVEGHVAGRSGTTKEF